MQGIQGRLLPTWTLNDFEIAKADFDLPSSFEGRFAAASG
jgi:hypothetical protein